MIALATPPPVTRDGARDAARAELSKAIYHRYDEPLPVRVVKAVLHWLGHAVSVAADHSPGGAAGAVVILVIVVALVALARWRLGPLRRDPRAPRAVLADTLLRAADHRRRAEQAAGDGRWDVAVVERMRAVAREMEERAIVEPRPGRTADELARTAAAEPGLEGGLFAAAARAFDEVAYGGRPGTPRGYEIVAAADRALSARKPALSAQR